MLDAWAEDRFELLVSPLIFDEYLRTCDRLSASHQALEYHSALATDIGRGHLVPDAPASGSITDDPDDDKFGSSLVSVRVSKGHGGTEERRIAKMWP